MTGFVPDDFVPPAGMDHPAFRLLERHRADFVASTGFTYTVLAPGVDPPKVIGCVYIYPGETPGCDAKIASWVRVQDAGLDAVLYRAVRDWLRNAWPFGRIEYAGRVGA
jgi:hypothetical protein